MEDKIYVFEKWENTEEKEKVEEKMNEETKIENEFPVCPVCGKNDFVVYDISSTMKNGYCLGCANCNIWTSTWGTEEAAQQNWQTISELGKPKFTPGTLTRTDLVPDGVCYQIQQPLESEASGTVYKNKDGWMYYYTLGGWARGNNLNHRHVSHFLCTIVENPEKAQKREQIKSRMAELETELADLAGELEGLV